MFEKTYSQNEKVSICEDVNNVKKFKCDNGLSGIYFLAYVN